MLIIVKLDTMSVLIEVVILTNLNDDELQRYDEVK